MTRPLALNLPGPVQAHIDVEKRRLLEGLCSDEAIQGLCVASFRVASDLEPEELIARVKDVLLRVDAHSDPGRWPADQQWPSMLPDWFVAACAPETTAEEALREQARRRALSYEQELAELDERRWQLSSWVYYMSPGERQWLWWDARPIGDKITMVGIDRLSDWYPELPGEFVWMLRACGAADVDTFDYEGQRRNPFPC